MSDPLPKCSRCDIKEPVIVSVLHDPLCPNCLYLKNHRPHEFLKEPVYGPFPTGGWPNPLSLFTR